MSPGNLAFGSSGASECLELGVPTNGLTLLLGGYHTRRGVGIVLSPAEHRAWAEANFEVHRWPSGRIIAVRLIVKDPHGKKLALFLISSYAMYYISLYCILCHAILIYYLS